MRGDPVKVRDGVWRFRISTGKDPVTDKYQSETRTIPARNITEAKAARAAALAEVRAQKVPPTKETLSYAIDKWVKSREVKQREGNTLRGYNQQAKAIKKEIGNVRLSDIDSDVLEDFYGKLSTKGLSPSTIERYHAVIRGSLNFAVKKKWIAANAAIGTDRPEVRKPKLTVPTVDQVHDLIAAARQHAAKEWHYFVPLAVASWCRRGELAALRWDHVDFKNGEIFIEWTAEVSKGKPKLKPPKGRTNRRLAMDFDVMALLAEYRQWCLDNRPEMDPQGFLFPTTDWVNPIHPDTFTGWFEQTRDLAKIQKVRLQDIRHFGPTQALAGGMPISMVSYRCGHAKISTTLDKYVDFIPERDRDVATFMGKLMRPQTAIEKGSDD